MNALTLQYRKAGETVLDPTHAVLRGLLSGFVNTPQVCLKKPFKNLPDARIKTHVSIVECAPLVFLSKIWAEREMDVNRDRLKIPHNDAAMKLPSERKTLGRSLSRPYPLFS